MRGGAEHLEDLHVAVRAVVVVDRALPARVPAEHEQVEAVRGGHEVARVELAGLEERVLGALARVRVVVVEEAADDRVLPRLVRLRCGRKGGGSFRSVHDATKRETREKRERWDLIVPGFVRTASIQAAGEM